MFYGATIWDPVLIIAQIVAIQCLFYVSLGLLLWVLLGTSAWLVVECSSSRFWIGCT